MIGDSDRDLLDEQAETIAKLEAENERLRERLGPRGLEVVMIGDAGHYVNEKVKAEIERLKVLLKVVQEERDEWQSTREDADRENERLRARVSDLEEQCLRALGEQAKR